MSHPGEKDAPHPTLDGEKGSSYIEALADEYRGYIARGRQDRAEEVAELIRENGGEVPADGPPPAGVEVETSEESSPVEKAVPVKAKRARKA